MYARDKRLCRRVLAGDREAFDEFFEAYFPGLYRFAMARLGQDHDDAEEVAQASLCKAVSKLHTYRGEASLYSWLCAFCRHEISAHYRRLGRSPRLELLAEESPDFRAALESLAGTTRNEPEQSVHRREVARLVQAILDGLPPHYGDVLEWKYFEDLKVNEIATRLGTTAKAAESLLTRARVAFRDAIAAMGEAGGGAVLPGELLSE